MAGQKTQTDLDAFRISTRELKTLNMVGYYQKVAKRKPKQNRLRK